MSKRYHNRPGQSSVIVCFSHFEGTPDYERIYSRTVRTRLKESDIEGRSEMGKWAAYLAFPAPPLLTLGIRSDHHRRLIVELVVFLSHACLTTPLYSAFNHQRNGHLPSLTPHIRVMTAAVRTATTCCLLSARVEICSHFPFHSC